MRLDHIAHPCRDPRETHRFYHEMLGLTLVQAYSGQELMLVYELPGGGSLAFTTSPAGQEFMIEEALGERQHVGLTVSNRKQFDFWLRQLREFGIRHRLVENERVYFSDPNGLVLEIELAGPTEPNPAASEILAAWRR